MTQLKLTRHTVIWVNEANLLGWHIVQSLFFLRASGLEQVTDLWRLRTNAEGEEALPGNIHKKNIRMIARNCGYNAHIV